MSVSKVRVIALEPSRRVKDFWGRRYKSYMADPSNKHGLVAVAKIYGPQMIYALMTFLSLSSFSYGQETVVTSVREVMAEENLFSSKGLRVGYVKPSLNWQLSAPQGKSSGLMKDDLNGISLGYVYLPVDSWGWTVAGTYIQLRGEDSHLAYLVRLEGNAAYVLNRWAYFKAGANGSKFTTGENESLDPSLGAQGGVGLQVTHHLGLEVGYVFMRQSKPGSIEFAQSGLEFGINGTF